MSQNLIEQATNQGLISNMQAFRASSTGGLREAVDQGIVDQSVLDELTESSGSSSDGSSSGSSSSGSSSGSSGSGSSFNGVSVGGLDVRSAQHARSLFQAGALNRSQRNEALDYFGVDPSSGSSGSSESSGGTSGNSSSGGSSDGSTDESSSGSSSDSSSDESVTYTDDPDDTGVWYPQPQPQPAPGQGETTPRGSTPDDDLGAESGTGVLIVAALIGGIALVQGVGS